MEWTREKSLALLDMYEQNPVLWNPKHGLYYNKVKKNDCWVKIASVMGCSTEEVRKKTESMLASFRRERAKGTRTVGSRRVYASNWFAFKRMGFLMNRTKPKARKTLTTMEDVNPSDEEPDASIDHPVDVDIDEEDDSSHVPMKYEEIQYTEAAPPPPRAEKPRKRPRVEEPRVDEALSVLRGAVAPPDASGVYGQHVGTKLRPRAEEARRLEEVLTVLRGAVAAPDASGVYGQHVANKLREYSKRTRAVVQHHFNEILFRADMGRYDVDTGASLPHPSYEPDPDPDPSPNSTCDSNKLRQRLQPELQFCLQTPNQTLS